jgi:hypothetical protein
MSMASRDQFIYSHQLPVEKEEEEAARCVSCVCRVCVSCVCVVCVCVVCVCVCRVCVCVVCVCVVCRVSCVSCVMWCP